MRLMLVLAGVMVAGLVVAKVPASATNPLLTAAALDRHFTGVVAERLLAGSYAYLRVRDGEGTERWVVTLAATDPGSREVEVRVFAQKQSFDSPRLGRSFSPLWFGSVTRASAARPAPGLANAASR